MLEGSPMYSQKVPLAITLMEPEKPSEIKMDRPDVLKKLSRNPSQEAEEPVYEQYSMGGENQYGEIEPTDEPDQDLEKEYEQGVLELLDQGFTKEEAEALKIGRAHV